MNEEQRVELSARLTMHEYVLEVFIAQAWSRSPAPEVDDACAAFLRAFRSSYANDPDADVESLTTVALRSTEMLERFLEKTNTRSGEIRKLPK